LYVSENGRSATPDGLPDRNADGIVVVAVVDSGVNPYHYDLLASHMPQHTNNDPSDDLLLHEDVAGWLPGFPDIAAFASYSPLHLGLKNGPDAESDALHDADHVQWDKIKKSTAGAIHYATIPGTKVIGLVSFTDSDGYGDTSHGQGSASVSVGNLYGSCPECLLVFVNGPSEAANEWVLQQDWIDVQTNSWGFSTYSRDRMYAGSDTELQREASERGQTIFFSAGNGQLNGFNLPNPTLFSSQEGPDWIITVGAISPEGASYTGHGKPADVASLGSSYPAGRGPTVSSEGTFGGTSNATPVTAGMYAKALYELRKATGATRMQRDGVVAEAAPGCMTDVPCALEDGQLTAEELRTALFRASEYTPNGWRPGASNQELPASSAEMEYLAEGHGSFWGRYLGDEHYENEIDRVVGFVTGAWFEKQDADQAAWMVADSYCRQMVWGSWSGGYYGQGTALPPPDPAWPMRTWLTTQCPAVVGSVVAVERLRDRP
jgi:hypothetical protein